MTTRHQERVTGNDVGPPSVCSYDGERWPCDTAVLERELDFAWRIIDNEFGVGDAFEGWEEAAARWRATRPAPWP